MNRSDSALIVIDVQEKLVPHINENQHVVWNIRRLLDGAAALAIPAFATEQYPKGLGHTVETLRCMLKTDIPEKSMFSCRECESLFTTLYEQGIRNLLLTGIETHVCVAQSALDLTSQGFNIFLAVDAVGSRFASDHVTAIRRMESSGITLTTTEAALFEWCETSGAEEFKTISKLVQEKGPASNAIGFGG